MKARIYIDRHIVLKNKKTGRREPAISVRTYNNILKCSRVVLPEGCTLIQEEDKAICSGATIWIECPDAEKLIIDGERKFSGSRSYL